MTWSHDEIGRIAFETLRELDGLYALEHSVAGLDALTEVEVHPHLAHGFAGAGFGVFREVAYPGDVGKRAKRSARERCDLVLTPGPRDVLRDPVEELKKADAAVGTLFGACEPPTPEGVSPEEAYWLEVKCVGQYTYTDGVPGANRAYGSELTGGLAGDLRKLSREERFRCAGLLLVLFTEDEVTAHHDLAAALHQCLDKGALMRSPVTLGEAITDRIGNQWMSVTLIPRG